MFEKSAFSLRSVHIPSSPMSLGKLQAALAAATNEVTVAAANINFDFTLVKYEAPKEYQPLGVLLSTKRKREAESGNAHITARRLGALFEGVCQETPKLVAAYGKRVSQIADSAASTNCKDYSSSIFAAYSGVDATSIWAAATSSRAALPVHLLSCMLARVFEAPEAISIWVELVKSRRQSIAEKLEGGESLPFSLAAAAAQQDISRSQLAEWDASARAWLRTADSIKEREQTQLRLVLQNINLPINAKTVVFSSVIDAWKSALETMESLVSGMPQAVHDGAAVLGLSAWHLCPDMAVFGSQTTEISMEDELIGAGGILSLGLAPDAKGNLPGVYWCLSLSNMRYYGHPVRSHKQLSVDPNRITYPQFQHIVLGTIIGSWKIPIQDTTESIKILLTMSKLIQEIFNMRRNDRWAAMISQPAAAYLAAKGADREIISKLIDLGRRRARDFISQEAAYVEQPFFGLSNAVTLLQCLKDSEARILLLRRLAARVPIFSHETTILRYRHEEEDSDEESEFEDLSQGSTPDLEMAEHFPPKQEEEDSYMQDDKLDIYEDTESNRMPTFPSQSQLHNFATTLPRFPAFEDDARVFSQFGNDACHHRWLSVPSKLPIEGERIHDTTSFRSKYLEILFEGQRLEFIFGDPKSAAIFLKRGQPLPIDLHHELRITADDLLWCLESGLFAVEKLKAQATNLESPIYRALLLVSVISQIYSDLSSATINVGCFSRPLEGTYIANQLLNDRNGHPLDLSKFPDYSKINRGWAMGLIAYLEGGNNIPLDQLLDVIAISAGDSIYVPKKLVCDPFQPCQSYQLERILGNVGKPGVVMLSSPQGSLMVRDIDLSSWRVSSSEDFTGQAQDCFAGTSLHLSFTDYHVPVFDTNSRGQQDPQLTMLESVISIRDAGSWVADIDVLRALDEGPIYRIQKPPPCGHMKDSPPTSRLTSLECWEDILDYPDGALVIKASGNAVARLAVTAFLVQHPKRPAGRVSICPSDICWKCTQQEHDFNIYIY